MVSHIWPRVRGSRPVVGSSRKISGGRVIRLAARSSRRRMPPENCAIGLVAASSRPNCSSRSGRGRAGLGAAEALEPAEEHQVLGGGEVLVDRGVLPGDAEELAHDVGLRGVRRGRRCSASPPSIGSRVASILSMVVLPAPLGPRTPKTSPRCTSRSTPSTARWSPNVLTRPWASTAGGAGGWRTGVSSCPEACGRPVSPQFHARTHGPRRAAAPPCTGFCTGLAEVVHPRRGATHIASPDLDDGRDAFAFGL